jgi:hypothetical protein
MGKKFLLIAALLFSFSIQAQDKSKELLDQVTAKVKVIVQL